MPLSWEEGSNPNAGTGEITTEWTFWCSRCSHWEQIGTENRRSDAIKVARRNGWKLVNGKWQCRRHRRAS